MTRKILSWAVLAFALFYLVTNPAQTAGAVRSLASGLGMFASTLAGGGQG